MKKTITKFMAIFLFCTCFLCMGTTQKANAAMDNSYDWGFGIIGVFSGETGSTLRANPTGSNDYVLDGNSVLFITNFVTNDYPGYCYVFVDGKSVGRSIDTGLYYDSNDIGNEHRTAIQINNLTPGKHTIEARADRPWSLGFNHGPMQKSDTINVAVPTK